MKQQAGLIRLIVSLVLAGLLLSAGGIVLVRHLTKTNPSPVATAPKPAATKPTVATPAAPVAVTPPTTPAPVTTTPKPAQPATPKPTTPAVPAKPKASASTTPAIKPAAPIVQAPKTTPAAPAIFFDDFSGASGSKPNPAYWTPSAVNWTGGLVQYSPNNVYLDGAGHMVLQLNKSGSNYISGAVSATSWADGRGDVLLPWGYGRVESRLKVAGGNPGFWPAFWMLGANFNSVSWPASGEIDIAEFFGTTAGYYATLHGPGGPNNGGAYNQAQLGIYASRAGVSDLSTDYHTYWVDRAVNRITIGIDAVTLGTWTPADLPSGAVWATNQPMFPIFDFSLNASPTDSTLPARMLVDWVRFTPSS